MTGEIGCDNANLSRSLKRLVGWGYLTEERQEDRRRKTYRLTFDDAETWRNRQQSIVGKRTNNPAEIVGNLESENLGNLAQTPQHYSSLKELNLPKDKPNSPEGACSASGGIGKVHFQDNVGAQLAKLERDLEAGVEVNLIAAYGFVADAWAHEEHRPWVWRLSEVLMERMTPEEIDEFQRTYVGPSSIP